MIVSRKFYKGLGLMTKAWFEIISLTLCF
jgi:hypothetical protein